MALRSGNETIMKPLVVKIPVMLLSEIITLVCTQLLIYREQGEEADLRG